MKITKHDQKISIAEAKIQLNIIDMQIKYDLSNDELLYILCAITTRAARQNMKNWNNEHEEIR